VCKKKFRFDDDDPTMSFIFIEKQQNIIDVVG
jgi:hypothetical protein